MSLCCCLSFPVTSSMDVPIKYFSSRPRLKMLLSARGPENIHHLPGILFSVHHQFVHVCHYPQVPVLSLCLGVFCILYQITQFGLVRHQDGGTCQWFLYCGLLYLYHYPLASIRHIYRGLFNGQFELYHSFLYPELPSIIFYDVNIFSERLVVFCYCVVFVLMVGVGISLAVMYCVCSVFFWI